MDPFEASLKKTNQENGNQENIPNTQNTIIDTPAQATAPQIQQIPVVVSQQTQTVPVQAVQAAAPVQEFSLEQFGYKQNAAPVTQAAPVTAPVIEPVQQFTIPTQAAPAPQIQQIPTPVQAPAQIASPSELHITVDQGKQQEVKAPRVHGFSRTLTLLALVVGGFLMFMDHMNILKISFGSFPLDTVYPIFVIFSCIVLWSYKGIFGKIFGLLLFLGVFGGFFSLSLYSSLQFTNEHKVNQKLSFAPTAGFSATKLYATTLLGNLSLTGANIPGIVEATYTSDRTLHITSGSQSNYNFVEINEDNNRNLLQDYATKLSLDVSNKKTTNIYTKNLFGFQTINLSDIVWSKAKIYGGVNSIDITLGTKMNKTSQMDISYAMGEVKIYVPRSIGVKLSHKHIAGQLELQDFDVKGKKYFESKNLATASKVLTLNVAAGISKFTLIWTN